MFDIKFRVIPTVEVTRNTAIDEMISALTASKDEEDEVDEVIFINSSPEVIEISSDSDTMEYEE